MKRARKGSGVTHPPATAATHRQGFTLIEMLVVLAIAAIVLGYAALRLGEAADRAAVHAAVAEAITTFNVARQTALERREPVAVSIDTSRSRLLVSDGGQLMLFRNLGATYTVRFSVSRDSMAYDARGIGIGAANLTLVARRGRAAETVFVSRLGRVRH